MSAPLTFGQLSVWRDIDQLPRARWHEANTALAVDVPAGVTSAAIRTALRELGRRHQALRTTYDLSDPRHPAQIVHAELEVPLAHDTLADGSDGAERADTLARQPFDLTGESSARALLLATPAGDQLLLAKHHIAADAWAAGVLTSELADLVAGRELPPAPEVDLLAFAREQRGPSWQARRDAAARHFAAVYTTPAAAFAAPDPSAGVVQGRLRSHRLYAAAAKRAAAAGVSLSTVLVDAYARAVAEHATGPDVRVGLMSANRFALRLRDVVTSLNQWVPLSVPVVGDGPDAASLGALQLAALKAYRVATCDVDAVTPAALGLAADPAPTCTYNLVSPWPIRAADEPDSAPVVEWEPVFNSLGPRCYLRAFEGEDTLALGLRTNGIGREVTADVLLRIYELITHRSRSESSTP